MLNSGPFRASPGHNSGLEAWRQVSLRDIVKLKNGTSFKADDWRTSGFPIIRIQNLKDVEAPFNYFKGALEKTVIINKGDLLFSWSGSKGTSFGPHIWKGTTGLLNQHIFKVEIKPDAPVERDYLYFALLYLTAAIEEKSYGIAALVHVRKGDLESTTIPLPSVPEQKAIAHFLRTVQQAKQATEKVIAATRQLKQSLMKHLFTYGPVPFDQADKVELKETEIGPVPASWSLKMLKELVTQKITDGTHKTPSYQSGGIPFITVTDVRDGTIDLAGCKFISPIEHTLLIKRCHPEPGDILLSKVGTLGKVVEISETTEFSIFVQLALIKTDRSKIEPTFLRMVLQSDIMQSQIGHNASQSTMKYIGVGKIAELQVPYPPRDEREEIIRQLKAVEQKLRAEESRKNSLDVLFQSLLHHLMTGKVRVPLERGQVIAEAV